MTSRFCCQKAGWRGIVVGLLAWAKLLGADVVVENNRGVKFVVSQQAAGFSLGSLYISGKPVEVPLEQGMLAFRNSSNDQVVWLYAAKAESVTASKADFSGEGTVAGIMVHFKVTLEAPEEVRAVKMTYEFWADRDLKGWRATLAFHSEFSHPWKCHMYPWAEDAKVIQRDPLSYMGIPSLFLYRDDRSLGLLWGMDPNWDYLDPTTWTRDIGLYFIDGNIPPQFRVGGDSLQGGFRYEVPMQIVLTDVSDPDGMITDLMKNWIQLNHYWPEPLSVRTNEEALNLFIEGRKKTDLWIPSKGYRLESGDIHTVFIYIGEQGLNAYFDYLVYEMTGDPVWRTRAFEQMDFISKGQNTNPSDPNYGVVQTAYNLNDSSPGGPGFNSVDRGSNVGYKVDLNAHLARYMFLTWKRVKDHEGVDHREWDNSARLAIDWVLRQQNNDGGLPQKVEMQPIESRVDNDWMRSGQPERVKNTLGEKSLSAASGRALPALQWVSKITGDPKYKRFTNSVEAYTLKHVQNQFYYNGHHPDLPPFELEEASIWGVCEFWLNKFDETGDPKYLDHAVADAYLALTWWCPKQLSWVKNPTQGGSAEQTNFLQYSVYSYQDRKPESIWRLYQKTGNPLFEALAKRVFQNIYWTQVTSGNLMGATHERIADPWLARAGEDNEKADFNSLGTTYMGEQSLDAFLQIVEMYRTGYDLYFGGNLANKVYPDGVAFYSSDNVDKKKVPLSVLPSVGTVNVTITNWTDTEKKWTESQATSTRITATHTVGDLAANTWYQVLDNGRWVGTFNSDRKGTIQFAYTGALATLHTFEVRRGQ